MRLVDGHQVDLRGREGVDRNRLNKLFRPKFMALSTDECWPWLAGCINNSGNGTRGQFRMVSSSSGGAMPAARAAYHFFVSEIPAGMYVCHRCDNENCVNPYHLFCAEPLENTRDMIRKGRAAWQKPRGTETRRPY